MASSDWNGGLPGQTWNGSAWMYPSGSGAAGAPSASSGGTNAQLQQSLANLEAAINSGNQRQYDLALGDLMGVFNGQETLKAQEDLGMVGDKPTLSYDKLAGIMPNGLPTEDARQFNLSTGENVLKTSAGLTGPKDYGDFMNYTGGGKSLLAQALGGRPASSAPTQVMQPMDLYALMQKLGMGAGQGASSPTPSPVGGGGTDPNSTEDFSEFPMMANQGDISYALSHSAYTPEDYQSYEGSNGFAPSWKGQTTSTTAGATGPLDTLWGSYDPASAEGSRTNNAALRRLVLNQYMATGGQGPGSGKTMYNGRNTDSVSDPEVAQLVGNYMAQRGASTTSTSGGTAPSWFQDYMTKLMSLGPNLNRGAAENLPLLHQLGMDNPDGLQTLLNPQGNINPAFWDSLGPVGQSLMTQAAGKVFGWDPTEMARQIDATRPLGAVAPPDMTRAAYAPLAA